MAIFESRDRSDGPVHRRFSAVPLATDEQLLHAAAPAEDGKARFVPGDTQAEIGTVGVEMS